MATTTNLGITYIEVGQRNKETSINTAFDILDASGNLGEYTLAGLPDATLNANAFALVTDASSGRTIVRSDGTNWRIVAVEGAIVS